MTSGSDALAAYIHDIEHGTVVLIGARDEASKNLTDTAKAAIKTCGATMIDGLSHRGAYALVGIKGGPALAEDIKRTTEGYAVAVARMEVVFSPKSKMPICDARVPVLPVEGYLSQGNLNLDAGCRYNLYETAQATQCLQGSWIVLTGSSNTLLEFGNLVNLLAPDEYHIRRDGKMIDTSAAVDAVIENGQVTHWETISNELPECRQVDIAVANQNRAECKKAIENLVVRAPAYGSGSVRITFLLSYFWYRTSLALEVVGEDTLWSGAEVAVVTQVGAWYSACVEERNNDSCPRKELLAMDRDPAIQVFKDEMEEVFWQMDSFCTGGGRAATLGCNVQTISWANEVRDNENFQVMNAQIEQAMAVRQSSSFRLIDVFRLGGSMPFEVVEGHGSQILNLWVWTVMFNAMCPAALAARGAYAVWAGNLCSGTEARFENCPDYSSSCLNGRRCKKWECMNSIPCTLTVTDLPLVGNTEGLCDDRMNITEFLADPILMDEPLDLDACHRGSLRPRLWCLQDVEWLLPLVSVIAALCIVGVQYAWETSRQKATRQSLESSKEDMSEARAVEADKTVTIQVHDEFEVGQEVPQEKPSADASKLRATNGEFAEDVMSSAPYAMKPKTHIEQLNSEATEAAMDINKPECHANAEEDLQKLEAREAKESATADTARLAQMVGTRKAGNRYPLGLARFMGSTHVALGNLFAKGATHPVYFFGWGFTWVPCFFMLSGFVLFSAYLKNPKEETMIQYVLRRSTTIYPLYAFSLIPAFIMQKSLGTMSADWPTLLAQSFLLQA
ncbi:Fam3b, partial [Symbiodinium necroappetens]